MVLFPTYNLGNNILKLYNALIQTRLTTSKTKRDIQFSKLGIRVASRVAERLKTKDIRNKKILGKSQTWMETQPSAQSPFQKLNFGSSSQKTPKSRYQTFLVLSSFTGFLYFVPNILPKIVEKIENLRENCEITNGPPKPIYLYRFFKDFIQQNPGTTQERVS